MIVPMLHVALARQLADQIAPGGSGSQMWTTGLSPTGAAPATHFISAGLIQSDFAALLANAPLTLTYAQAVGIVTTLQAIQALYAASVIRADEEPFAVLQDLNLQLVQALPETP